MAHKVNPYIIIDFETGGLESQKHAATQIAMLCIDGNTLQEVGRYESYIFPYLYEYTDGALAFTGVSMQLLNLKGKDIKEVMSEVVAKIKEWKEKTGATHTKKPILVGQNIGFDIGFFQQLAKETKTDLSKLFDGREDFYGNFQPNYEDTQNLGKGAWGHDELMNKFNLTLMMQKAGLDIVDAHSAMNDVVATKELFIYFINKLRSQEGTASTTSKTRVRDHFPM